MKRILLVLLLLVCVTSDVPAQSLLRESFNSNWHFRLTPARGTAGSNESEETVNLPHDWAIYGDFSRTAPSGTGGGALPGGFGTYTKQFTVDRSDSDRRIRIDFDGAYMNTEVIVNGHSLGTRPYGYIPFGYDITPYIIYDGPNTVTVNVDNTDQPNSRWYSGCGIYRNVWLTRLPQVHVAHDGTFVTYNVENGSATLNIQCEIENQSGRRANATVRHIVRDAEGNTVCVSKKRVEVPQTETDGGITDAQTLRIDGVHLWNIDDPYMYSVETRVTSGNSTDIYRTCIGVRYFEFDAERGFLLNGQKVNINGVCNHHDYGCLGTAVNRRAIERRLQILKDMGCNAIRCSHNPPSPELLDLCDRMGFIVMDEAFDMWRRGKTANDYARYFDEWYRKDLEEFVKRDRNHPSVFIWSIGNEVLEQWSDAKADTLSLEQANLVLNFGHPASMLATEEKNMSVNSLLTKVLADIVHDMDPTRPVTAGCNEPSPWNHLFASGALDVIGYNYHNGNIPSVPRLFPGKPFVITESNSALMTRGYYRMPSDSAFLWPARWDIPFYDPSYSCSSYDNCHAPWGSTHEETMVLLKKNPWISGQFVWTGFDYIGEPTPYGWPARSSYFGIVDLAGFPKDIYYLYRSEWTDTPTLHLFPHWNEMPDNSSVRDMWCYYNNADEVELFVNGESQGVRSKNDSVLHAVWRVEYKPGEVTAVARKDGKETARQTIRTAGNPAAIRLTPDRSELMADGCDLSFVTVEILDAQGNPCPLADNDIRFELQPTGPETPCLFIAGVDNGLQTSMERFKQNHRKAFNGKCLVVVQNNGNAGRCRLTAVSDGLEACSVEISCTTGTERVVSSRR